MDFGYLLDESNSFAVMDGAVDAGINHFDTADVYGGPQAADMARDTASLRRSSGVGCSAAGAAMRSSWPRRRTSRLGLGPNDRRLSAYHLRRACEASLRRPQTDHIDLYQMHDVDRATPWEEIWQAWSNWSARAR
jgi:aryl-alcohol dehydrogenase-like predicted oxidoreductase